MSTVEYNGEEYSEEAFEQATRFVSNAVPGGSEIIRTDSQIQKNLGKTHDGRRDVYEVLGYEVDPKIEDYRKRFERQDIANRIVSLPAEDTWKEAPEIIDGTDNEDRDPDKEDRTQFEQDIENLGQFTRFYSYLRRVDVVSGIGEYGVLFIGVADGEDDISVPVDEDSLSGPEDIVFHQPIAQDSVEDWTLGMNDESRDLSPNDEMYTKPTQYEIDFAPIGSNQEELHTVDWTRVIHVPATEPQESEIKAPPRLEPVLNRLIDLEKVVGASGEMFWSGADRKFIFNIDPENAQDIPDSELDRLDDEAQLLVHEMRQHMKAFGMDVEVIDGDEPDPTGIVDSILKFISGSTGIPVRKLVGSERGELASSQDEANWFGYIESRRNTFAEPLILRQYINRMMFYGAVSEPTQDGYLVDWPNLFELNEIEKTELQVNRSTVIDNISGGSPSTLPASSEDLFDYAKDGSDIEWQTPETPQLPDMDSMPSLMDESEQMEQRLTDESEQPADE